MATFEGLSVAAHLREHHAEVRAEIDKALATWDPALLKSASKPVVDNHCNGCRMPGTLVGMAETVLWELKQKQKLVQPALANGNVQINFGTKEVVTGNLVSCSSNPNTCV